MNFEIFESKRTSFNTNVGENGLLIDFLNQGVEKASQPHQWNPFFLPELQIADSSSSNKVPLAPEEPSTQNARTENPSTENPRTQNDAPTQKDTSTQDNTLTQKEATKPTPSLTKEDTLKETDKQSESVSPKQPTQQKIEPPTEPSTQTTQTAQTAQKESVTPPTAIDPPLRPTEPPQSPTEYISFRSEWWGRFGRQYKVDTAGNAEYEVKKGDTYSAVARDILEKRSGRVYDVRQEQDRNEILRFSKELAAHNGVPWRRNNFVLIHPGDKIKIPTPAKVVVLPEQIKPNTDPLKKSTQAPARTFEPKTLPGAFSIQPQDKLYNPMQPPGFEGLPGQSWTDELEVKGKAYDIDKRLMQASRDIPGGGKEFVYAGEVDSGFKSGTSFTAREIINANGQIAAREIQYAEPLEMKLNLPDAQNQKLKVVAVGVYFDQTKGIYRSQCRTADGRVLYGQHAADGTVLWGMNSRP